MPDARHRKRVETDLFGNPVRLPPPDRKIVARPDGRGFAIAVRQPARTSYIYVGAYGTRSEAAVALRAGVGLEPGGDQVEVSISVYLSPFRRRR